MGRGVRWPGDPINAQKILRHFVNEKKANIDGVVVFTVKRSGRWPHQTELHWAGFSFANDANLADQLRGATEKIILTLPKPRFEGYQARSLHLQKAYAVDDKGWYLGTMIQGQNDDSKVYVPARAVLDLLAGRISLAQFHRFIGDTPDAQKLFEGYLKRGETLHAVEIAERDVDSDDDHLVFHFRDDPAARRLKNPRLSKQ